jgi:ABC-type nitrate/sulfonate/bicarbonate transport system ATPase subunit
VASNSESRSHRLAANAKVLLLDEPFSALDRPIREQLHHELMTIQEETGLVAIYVTHSLDDALTAGQRPGHHQ